MAIVDYNDESNLITETDKEMLTKLIHFTLKEENILFDYEVSVSFVRDNEIRELNKTYRNIDKETDVLSFPLIENFDVEFLDHIYPLGDIVISIDKVKEQSENYNHSFEREIAFLTVHSILHLLGFTHETENKKNNMFTRQKEILKEFGLERK